MNSLWRERRVKHFLPSGKYEIIHSMFESMITFLCTNPYVETIALSGSKTGLLSDVLSDYDMYIYSERPIGLDFRHELANRFARQAEVGNDFFDDGDELILEDGTAVDLMYRPLDWAVQEVQRVWSDHKASVGYSTAFIHTIKTSRLLYDRNGWFSRLQEKLDTPYPPQLKQAIIAKNHPLLRSKMTASYYEQIEKALKREDRVSQAHRTTALLSSYFDILFAINGQTHPGEKQVVKWAMQACSDLPSNFSTDVEHVVSDIGKPLILDSITSLLDNLDELLEGKHIQL